MKWDTMEKLPTAFGCLNSRMRLDFWLEVVGKWVKSGYLMFRLFLDSDCYD